MLYPQHFLSYTLPNCPHPFQQILQRKALQLGSKADHLTTDDSPLVVEVLCTALLLSINPKTPVPLDWGGAPHRSVMVKQPPPIQHCPTIPLPGAAITWAEQFSHATLILLLHLNRNPMQFKPHTSPEVHFHNTACWSKGQQPHKRAEPIGALRPQLYNCISLPLASSMCLTPRGARSAG